MNLLIYFCIPLVVTGRVTRGTYGREDGEIRDNDEDTSRVTIVETEAAGGGAGNPETSETTESYAYANFYPGHIDYENPELKEYAVDHQDGTYYRKGIGESAVLTKPALLRGRPRGLAAQPEHPSHIPTDIYNNIRDKKLHQEVGHHHHLGSPAAGLGLLGVDPRYAALLAAAQYGQGQKLAYMMPLAPQYAPGGGLQEDPRLGAGPYDGRILLQSRPLNPYFQHQGHPGLQYSPYAPYHRHHHHQHHQHQLGLEDEQIPVAQQVVPTLQAPLGKAIYAEPSLKTAAVPPALHQQQQLLYKSLAAPALQQLIPLYQQQPALLKESPLVNVPDGGLPLYHHHPQQQLQLLQPQLLGLGHHQPVLKATVGGGLHQPILKTAPGVEATIVPAIEEHVPELEPARYPSPGNGIYFALKNKPVVYTEKAVLKESLAPAYHDHHHPQKAPLLAYYDGSAHLDPSLPGRILSAQKSLVKSLISSDSKKGLRDGGHHHHKTHIELVPSLSYGSFSYSMYPDAKGEYGPAVPSGLGHHHHHHSHAHNHNHEEAHHHEHDPHHHHHH